MAEPAALHAALKRAVTRTPPPMTPAQRDRLADMLAADTRRLARETGIVYDLSAEAGAAAPNPSRAASSVA